MSKRHLPSVFAAGPAAIVGAAAAKPGVRTGVKPAVLERWNPAIRGAAAESEETGVISVLDIIGEDFFGEGITARRVAGALRAIGPKPVRVDINSPGGDYFEGLAIYNMLREHPHPVTVHVLGLAASAASVIAMAGDTVRMPRAGFLMIHKAWVMAMGNEDELRDIADWLKPFDSAAADIYAARSGLAKDDIMAMLAAETWIPGSEAIEQGFADDFLPSDAAQEDAEGADAKARAAAMNFRKLDTVLARGGMPRSERRELFKTLGAMPGAGPSGGTPRAAPTGMQDAAVLAGVHDLLAKVKSL